MLVLLYSPLSDRQLPNLILAAVRHVKSVATDIGQSEQFVASKRNKIR